MSEKNIRREEKCPFTDIDVKEAYGQEVHMFLHVHLRGYDEKGEGKHMDSSYFDKYGAPVLVQRSWSEGYHAVEQYLAKHFNECLNEETEFPPTVGVAGGSHLYQPVHYDNEKDEPWNVTGWIPLQRRWLHSGKFFDNRHFLGIRGNEIQNNLWDYHPHMEEDGMDLLDDKYEQVNPIDKYHGGYYFSDKKEEIRPFGRYLHIMSLKSHKKDETTNRDLRFNYIVHPLAYPLSTRVNSYPDNSVDAMQWCCINIPKETHFCVGSPWGDKCHGIEIFNDFTYYNSYQDITEPEDPNNDFPVCNGELANCGQAKNQYIYWFEPYPLQFAEFLLETALRSGAYLLTLTCNDAFYDRKRLPPIGKEGETEDDKKLEEGRNNLISDPKGSTVARSSKVNKDQIYWRCAMVKNKAAKINNLRVQESIQFLNSRPYRCNTAFGHTTFIDTKEQLKDIVYHQRDEGHDRKKGERQRYLEDDPERGLNAGELKVMEFLSEGRYYSQTGVYDIFEYDDQIIPFVVEGQRSNSEKLCYEITSSHELKFTFPRCKENRCNLIWRYTLLEQEVVGFEHYTHGYFKLDKSKKTVLDLTNHKQDGVKWLYFTAFHEFNPQRRAWFNTIRGPAFGQAKCDAYREAELEYHVVNTQAFDLQDGTRSVKEGSYFEPITHDSGELDFCLDKCPTTNEKYIYVYSMQVNALQQDFSVDTAKNSCTNRPPRYLETVNGYFPLNDDYPTRLRLNYMWDKSTVKNNTVFFYALDPTTGQPTVEMPKPKRYSPQFESAVA